MKRIALTLAALLAFSSLPAVAGGTQGPVVKCHPKDCTNHGTLPVDTGKGNPCKAHPRSCR